MYNSMFTSVCWKTHPKAFLSIHNYTNSIFSLLEIPSEIGSKIIIKHKSTGNSDCNTAFDHLYFVQIENSQIAPDTSCIILVSNTDESNKLNSSTAGLKWKKLPIFRHCIYIMYSYSVKIYIKASKHKQNTIYIYLNTYYTDTVSNQLSHVTHL